MKLFSITKQVFFGLRRPNMQSSQLLVLQIKTFFLSFQLFATSHGFALFQILLISNWLAYTTQQLSHWQRVKIKLSTWHVLSLYILFLDFYSRYSGEKKIQNEFLPLKIVFFFRRTVK